MNPLALLAGSSIWFRLCMVGIAALALAGFAFKAGVDYQQGEQAQLDLKRERAEQDALAKRRAWVRTVVVAHERVKTEIETEFKTIEKEVFRDVQANPDVYGRECFTAVGMQQLTDAIHGRGAGGREPAAAVPGPGRPSQ